ncbi:DHCW motif cupin fold protein [Acetobacter indonesiensis]|uniref:DHCW motif cupin fold protein n=1 Tax=Acetobacter indonesiensis TaxID=104101 RepID=UPI001F1AACF4|nr:DHCW motif cupin fold protein [Acetobacter indonesiensis]MCG0996333.1 DHCW motif cupin fold protein [Acetobacter indonesiensis]
MKLPDMKFKKIDWCNIKATVVPGEVGIAHSYTDEENTLRTRVMVYEPGFVLDHYCDRGHVLYVIEGEIVVDLADGREFSFPAGTGFAVSDFGDKAHRMRSDNGARVFIVD